jgi:hypothetical protein
MQLPLSDVPGGVSLPIVVGDVLEVTVKGTINTADGKHETNFGGFLNIFLTFRRWLPWHSIVFPLLFFQEWFGFCHAMSDSCV